MKLTATQLKKIIREEVNATRHKHTRQITEVEALTPTEVEMAKDRILRALGEASAELVDLFEMTEDPDAMSASNDLDALITLVTNITGTPE
jgi:hypothetical protein